MVGLDDLLKLQSLVRGAQYNVKTQAEVLAQLVIRFNVIHRLSGSLSLLFTTLAHKTNCDAAKFASIYQQMLEMCEQLLDDSTQFKINQGFPSMLAWGHRQLLNSFLTLVKSSPSFIVTALISMSYSDVRSFVTRPVDSFEQLATLQRESPLDILWTSMFPPDVNGSQRLEYFAIICASLIREKKCERLCYAVFDRVLDASGHGYAAALEHILLSFLQEGNFLASNNTTPMAAPVDEAASETSTPTSEVPSPSFPAVVSRLASDQDRSHKPPLPVGGLAADRRGSTKSDGGNSFKASSGSLRSLPEDLLDGRSVQFLDNAVITILDFLSSDDSGAIPSDFILFARMILVKLSESQQQSAAIFIVIRYFICKHVYRILTRPERLGILADYYIGDSQRQRVLYPIFQRLYRLAMAHSYDLSGGSTRIDGGLVVRLDKIMAKFAVPSAYEHQE
jgi:hypothetical protein